MSATQQITHGLKVCAQNALNSTQFCDALRNMVAAHWKNSKNYYTTECEGITEISEVNRSFQKQHKKNFKYQTGDSLVKQPHRQDTFAALTLDTLRYRRHITC